MVRNAIFLGHRISKIGIIGYFTNKPNSFEVTGVNKVVWGLWTGTKVENVKIKRQKKTIYRPAAWRKWAIITKALIDVRDTERNDPRPFNLKKYIKNESVFTPQAPLRKWSESKATLSAGVNKPFLYFFPPSHHCLAPPCPFASNDLNTPPITGLVLCK